MRILIVVLMALMISACNGQGQTESASTAKAVERQQGQYATVQPVPVFDWSLERDLVIQLYGIRNMKAVTHSVWRSDRGMVEGDCPSIGFGIPYDTSLTNPLVAVDIAQDGDHHNYNGGSLASIEQPEPNGIFASKNTSATWVMCAGETGFIEPVYVETKVTVYPYPVAVDYSENRVVKSGKSTVTISR